MLLFTRIVVVLVAAALLMAGVSLVATVGIVLLAVSAAVLWMSFVYLVAMRLAPRHTGTERRIGLD